MFSGRRKVFAPLLARVYGIVMELVEIFIPSRDASFADIGINTLGVTVGFGVYLLAGVLARHRVSH